MAVVTKLGPHVITRTVAGLDWTNRAPIVKSIDDIAVLEAAPPNAIRVFRHFLPVQNLDDPQGTVDAILEALGGYRHPLLYVGIWNESHPSLDVLKTAVALLHSAGVKTCGASWGTGDYVQQDFDDAKQAGQDAIEVHAYWATAGFTPWNALRYRQFWKPGYPPVIIGECGRDVVRDGPDNTYIGQPGWKLCGITAEQYAAELMAYDAEIEKDSFVLGATPFTSGPTSS